MLSQKFHPSKIGCRVVMCDISEKYRFCDNFVDIVIVSIFDTALAD